MSINLPTGLRAPDLRPVLVATRPASRSAAMARSICRSSSLVLEARVLLLGQGL
jgi:hypothetical protein